MKSSKKILLTSRSFKLLDQNFFAKFSGDFNPIHVNPNIARRTISGQCVVHGIHGLMWALESLLSKTNIAPSAINVKFLKPIFLDEEVNCSYDPSNNKLEIKKESITLFEIRLKYDSIVDFSIFNLSSNVVLNSPIERGIYELINLPIQDFFYRGDFNLAYLLFPNIIKYYGLESCCEIATISEIVGMQAPGLHSFLLATRINFQRNEFESNFSIEHVDERFNLIKISINATSLNCKVDAFLRQKPIQGASLISMQRMVDDSEFSNVRALIIGGSRGLGESVAKLIALGGGESLITYSSGYDECLKLSKDISEIGKKCSIAKIKIPDDLHLLQKLGTFNQIYYFPTPKIFGKRNAQYDKILYDTFYEIYVVSFKRLVINFSNSLTKISIFYPSSTAVSNPLPELSEYIDAKMAGEKFCKKFDNKNISIIVSRIPRTKTDQTLSLIETKSENPEDVMLPLVREMLTLI
jgi:hypothetical protein